MSQTLTIAKKELRVFFHHPLGYILAAVFVILNNFFFFRNAYIANEATLRPMFEFLPWLLLFFIPAVAMRAIAEDERRGTAETTLAQPIETREYVAGKFLGSLGVGLLLLFLTLGVPVLLSQAGSFDWGVVSAEYIGGILLVSALMAIGVCASAFTKNQVLALLAGFGVIFVFMMAGFETVLLAAPPAVARVLERIAILPHFQNITRGLLDLRDIVYFGGMLAIFGFGSYALTSRRRLVPGGSRARQIGGYMATVVALAVLFTAALSFWNLRLDLTRSKAYALSEATRQILRGISTPITLTLYASKNLPPQAAGLARDIRDFVADYVANSGGKVKAEVLYPDTSDEARQNAVESGITPVQFNILSKGEFQAKEGFLGIVVSASPTKEVIPFVDSVNDFEYRLSGLIKKLTATTPKKVSILAGHDERILEGGYQAFGGELAKNYEIEQFDSANVSSTPPAAGSVLLVVGPRRPLDTFEEARITEFLKNGGKAFFLVDGVALDERSLSVTPETATRVASFIERYGVRVRPDMMFDLRSNENVTFGGGAFSVILPYPFWIRALPVGDSLITKNISSVVLPWSSSLEIEKDIAGDAAVTELLRASQFAGTQEGTFTLAPNQQPNVDRSALGTRLAAVALSNLSVEGSDKKSRIVVVGNSRFLADGIAANKPENIAFALNAIDWLLEDEGLLAIRSKSAAPKPLVFTSDRQKDVIKYANLIGIPALILLIGFVVLFRRHRLTKRVYV